MIVPRPYRGASVLQSVFVVILAALLAVPLLRALERAERVAERTAVNQALITIEQAINREVITSMIAGRKLDLASLDGANPMELTGLLVGWDSRYGGEVDTLRPEELTPARWYFDRARRELVYVPARRDWVDIRPAEAQTLRFRLRFVYDDRNANGTYESDADGVQGLILETLTPFRWRED